MNIESTDYKRITPCSCNICPLNLKTCPCKNIGKCGIKENSVDFAILQKEDDPNYIALVLCMDENTQNFKLPELDNKTKKIETCSLLNGYDRKNRHFSFFIPQTQPTTFSEIQRFSSKIGKWETIRQFINYIDNLNFFYNKFEECKKVNFPNMEKFIKKTPVEVVSEGEEIKLI